MKRFSARHALLVTAAAVVLMTGCDTQVVVDPEGLRCDRGDLCPSGYTCRGGYCRSESTAACLGVSCNAPPPAACRESVLVEYEQTGLCNADTGTCLYPSKQTDCANGCAEGACLPCSPASCTVPPSPECRDANTLRTFTAPGTCDGAQCRFEPTDVTCPNGCADGACTGADLCAGVTCTTPPAARCSGNVLTTYAATGTCQPGTGQCSYTSSSAVCSGQCVAGACVSSSLTFTQVGPGIRSSVNAVDMVPGSSGAHVLAVGPKGYAAKWNGSVWTQLPTNTSKDLYAVYLRSAQSGFIVGEGGTAFRYDGSALLPLSLPNANVDLVAVHGRGSRVLIAGRDGRAWRSSDAATFTAAAMPTPPLSTSYEINDAFIAPDDAERLAGACTSVGVTSPCVFYAPAGSTSAWQLHHTNTGPGQGFGAVGPAVDGSAAFVAQGINVRRHTNTGSYSQTNTPQGLSGSAVVGIAPDSNNSGTASFLLTSRTSTAAGRLYHFVKGNAPVPLMRVHGAKQALSRSHSGGVIVSDSGTVGANVFRRGANTDEALDLAGNWVDADAVPNGRRVLANGYADFAVKEPGSATWRWIESPVATAWFRGVVAGTQWVLGFGDGGRVYRWAPGGDHTLLNGGGTQNLTAGCRNGDNEAFIVGAAGTILRFDGTALAQMQSPTAETLTSVHCTGAGEAFAAGRNGTVLRLSGGVWSALSPALGGAPQLSSVWAGDGVVAVAGDGFFAVHGGTGWSVLPSRGGLSNLVGRSRNELYATAVRDVVRWDGASWTVAYSADETFTGGTAAGTGALFVGPAGMVVEGRP